MARYTKVGNSRKKMEGVYACACGCSARYASYHRNGKYWISVGHYRKWKAAEEAKVEAAAAVQAEG